MNKSINARLGLLRVYASTDKEYMQLIRNVRESEQLLEELEESLSEEQIQAIWSVISAHEAANRYMTQLACKHMIFRSEIQKENNTAD